MTLYCHLDCSLVCNSSCRTRMHGSLFSQDVLEVMTVVYWRGLSTFPFHLCSVKCHENPSRVLEVLLLYIPILLKRKRGSCVIKKELHHKQKTHDTSSEWKEGKSSSFSVYEKIERKTIILSPSPLVFHSSSSLFVSSSCQLLSIDYTFSSVSDPLVQNKWPKIFDKGSPLLVLLSSWRFSARKSV